MSLDRRSPRAIRGPFKRPNAGAFRTRGTRLKPIGRFTATDDMTHLAQTIVDRLASNRKHMVAGSFVLGDKERWVFVACEAVLHTQGYVERHLDQVIGLYAASKDGKGDVEYPSIADLIEDLCCHFASFASIPGVCP